MNGNPDTGGPEPRPPNAAPPIRAAPEPPSRWADLQSRPRRAEALGVSDRYERARQVRLALDRLPDGNRAALVMAYVGGYSQAEIAVGLGLELQTVRRNTYLGLRQLGAILDENPGG